MLTEQMDRRRVISSSATRSRRARHIEGLELAGSGGRSIPDNPISSTLRCWAVELVAQLLAAVRGEGKKLIGSIPLLGKVNRYLWDW